MIEEFLVHLSHFCPSHCVVSLSKTLYLLLSTGSTQEDPSRHDCKIVDWEIKNQNEQTRSEVFSNEGKSVLYWGVTDFSY